MARSVDTMPPPAPSADSRRAAVAVSELERDDHDEREPAHGKGQRGALVEVSLDVVDDDGHVIAVEKLSPLE